MGDANGSNAAGTALLKKLNMFSDHDFAPGERRRHERKRLKAACTIHEIDQFSIVGVGCKCDSIDVSRSGIAITSRKMFHKGTHVVLLMPLNGGQNKAMVGKVQYSRYSKQAMYIVGVQFCAPPSSIEFQRWLIENKVA